MYCALGTSEFGQEPPFRNRMSILTSNGWIFLGLAVVTLGLDTFAVRKVFASPFYEPAQRWVTNLNRMSQFKNPAAKT
jgi:hypothetical protein